MEIYNIKNTTQENIDMFNKLCEKYHCDKQDLKKYKSQKANTNEKNKCAPWRWFLQVFSLNKNDILKSEIFNFFKSIIKGDEELLFCPLQSPVINQTPDIVCPRGEMNGGKFLEYARDNKILYCISGIKIMGKIIYFIFCNKFWFGYKNYKKGNNHPIRFTLDAIRDKFVLNGIQDYNTDKLKKYKYSFFTCIEFNEESKEQIKDFIKFINVFSINEDILNNQNRRKNIPGSITNQIDKIYSNKCILSNEKCKGYIDWFKAIQYKNNSGIKYVTYHHLIPVNYFIKNISDDFINWNIINDLNNIIPLCHICHIIIHNKKDEIKKMLEEIFNIVEQKNQFNEYLIKLGLTKEKIINDDFINKYYL